MRSSPFVWARQEEPRHPDRLLQQAAAVAPQVEDQPLGPSQLAVGLGEFLHRGAAEAVDLDVADAVASQVGGIDGVQGNFVADNHETESSGRAVAHDVDPDLRAGLAPQVFGNVRAAHPHGVERVDTHDAVVGPDADPLGGSSGDGVHHDHRVAQDVELHADAAEFPVETLLHALHLLRADVGRMGVQLFEHARDGALDDGFHLHLVDVKPRKVAENLREFLELARIVLGLRREGQDGEDSEYDEQSAHGVTIFK